MSEFIKVERSADKKPIFTRGDALVWRSRVSLRWLGENVVRELYEYLPEAGYDLVVEKAAKLASQEPPFTIEESWKFYDGVREALNQRQAEAVDEALSQGAKL